MSDKTYLKISPNHERVGFGIYCSKCKGSPNNGICASKKKEHKSGKYCNTPEKHSYKLEFHTKEGKRTKVLIERDEKIAADIAYEEYKFFKLHGHFSDEGKDVVEIESKPISLFDWIQAFIAFKVKPTKNRIPVYAETLKDYTRHLNILVEALIEQSINAKLIEPKDLNDEKVQIIFDFLNRKTKDGTTQSKYFRTYRTLWNYLINEARLDLPPNPFNNWHFDIKDSENEIIYEDEFLALLNNIDLLPKSESLKGKVRRRNFDWLRKAFKLGLFMGIRRQDIPCVKWNEIRLNRKNQELYGGIVVVHDKKLSRINKQERYTVVSINLDLAELLIEMGYDEFKDQDKYIIDPDEEFSREHIKNCLSNSFAYYIKPLALKRKLSLECLRKTYATFSNQAGGEEFSMEVTKHSNKEVMVKHYWNKIEKARTHEKFPRIFPKK